MLGGGQRWGRQPGAPGDGKPRSALCRQVQAPFSKADAPKPGRAGGAAGWPAQPTALTLPFARDKCADNVCCRTASGSSERLRFLWFWFPSSWHVLDGVSERDQKLQGESYKKLSMVKVKRTGTRGGPPGGVLSPSSRTCLFCTPVAL